MSHAIRAFCQGSGRNLRTVGVILKF